jgi:acetylornithine deacetylase
MPMAERAVTSRIAGWVDAHAGDLVELVQELVRTGRPSTEDEGPPVEAAQQLVSERAASFGLETDRRLVDLDVVRARDGFVDSAIDFGTRPYVVARASGRSDRRSLLLNGHVDVVAAGDASLWSRSPFSGELRDGSIHGRGSVDAKGPLAALLFGLACARAVAEGELGDLTLVSVADEESGGMCTLDSLVRGDRADAVVVGEPTELAIAPGARGATGFRLTVRGLQAHSGAAFEGVNAISKATTYVAAIERLQRDLDRKQPNGLYDGLPVAHAFNIATIHGGEFTGVVPDRCTIAGVAPAIGDETVEDARASLTAAVDSATALDPWLVEHPPELEWTPPSFEPSYTSVEHPLVATAARAVARELGSPPAVRPLLGGSDLRFYTRHFGIPGLHIGPGALRHAHGVDESLPVAELLAATRTVAAIVLDWSGGSRDDRQRS